MAAPVSVAACLVHLPSAAAVGFCVVLLLELACCTRHCSLVVVRGVSDLEVRLFSPEFS